MMIPVLGTAMWGWSIDHERALALADCFYEAGGRWFDTAANYPIDKDPMHFGLAERWLAEWLKARGHSDARVIAKAGALTNDGSQACDVSADALRDCYRRYQDQFGVALQVFSIHWDNRANPSAVADTVDFLDAVLADECDIGLSGIKYPELYAAAMTLSMQKCWIQVKHNILNQTSYASYRPFHGTARFLAYGINAGGIQPGKVYSERNSASLRQAPVNLDLRFFEKLILSWKSDDAMPRTFNELGLALLTLTSDFKGVLIGPSKFDQLTESMAFIHHLSNPAIRDRVATRLRAGLKTFEAISRT